MRQVKADWEEGCHEPGGNGKEGRRGVADGTTTSSTDLVRARQAKMRPTASGTVESHSGPCRRGGTHLTDGSTASSSRSLTDRSFGPRPGRPTRDARPTRHPRQIHPALQPLSSPCSSQIRTWEPWRVRGLRATKTTGEERASSKLGAAR